MEDVELWFKKEMQMNPMNNDDKSTAAKSIAVEEELPTGQKEEIPVGQKEMGQSNAQQRPSKSHKDQSAACDLQETIQPGDSVSNIVSNTSKKSKGSKVSSTTSSRLSAQAEMAALVVRQKMIQDRHALEDQMEQLRMQNEQLRKKKSSWNWKQAWLLMLQKLRC